MKKKTIIILVILFCIISMPFLFEKAYSKYVLNTSKKVANIDYTASEMSVSYVDINTNETIKDKTIYNLRDNTDTKNKITAFFNDSTKTETTINGVTIEKPSKIDKYVFISSNYDDSYNVILKYNYYNTVSFDPMVIGTLKDSDKTKKVLNNTEIGTLPNPIAREGYSFDGWYENLLNLQDVGTCFNDCELVSLKNEELTIKANNNGGTHDSYIGFASNSNAQHSTTTPKYNSSYGQLTEIDSSKDLSFLITNNAFNKNYFVFWDKDLNAVIMKKSSNGVIDWYKSYNINSGTIKASDIPSDAKYVTFRLGIQPSVEGQTYTTKVIIKRGGIPKEWVSYYKKLDATDKITSDTEYFGRYTPVNYKINIDYKGGSGANPSTYTYVSNDITLNNPNKRNGYKFMGYTVNTGTTPATITDHSDDGWSIITTGLEEYTTSNPFTAKTRDHILGNKFSVTSGTKYRAYVTAKRTEGERNLQGGLVYWNKNGEINFDGFRGSFTKIEELDNGYARYYKDVTVPDGMVYAKTYYQIDNGLYPGTSNVKSKAEGGVYDTTWLLADMDIINLSNNIATIPTRSQGDKSYRAEWEHYYLTIQYMLNGSTFADKYDSNQWTIKDNILLHYESTNHPANLHNRTISTFDEINKKFRIDDQIDFCNSENEEALNLKKTGYYVEQGKEWNTKADGTGKSYNQDTVYKVSDLADISSSDKHLLLYANWKPKSVTTYFHPNGGSGTDGQAQVFTYDVLGQKFGKKNFSRTGYSQGNWAESASGSGIYSIESGVSNSWIEDKYNNTNHRVDLYAKWTINNYNLTVKASNSHGTVSGESSGSKQYNKQMTVKATPKTGYKFIGWTDGTNTVSTNASYTFNMPAKNYTLIANFILDSVNNGEIVPYDNNITYIVVKDKKSWKDAENYAQSLGGHLARVDTKEKNELLISKVSSISDTWIGLTDEEKEGTWKWCWGGDIAGYCDLANKKLSGWKFEAWRRTSDGGFGEPNNTTTNDGFHNNGENYAELRLNTSMANSIYWNDLPNTIDSSGTGCYFIVEIHNN